MPEIEGPGYTPTELKKDPFDNIRSVGPDKPVGYLPIPTISRLGSSIKELRSEAEAKGLKTRLFPIGSIIPELGRFGISNLGGGALYCL